jgi:hypothetical protein
MSREVKEISWRGQKMSVEVQEIPWEAQRIPDRARVRFDCGLADETA